MYVVKLELGIIGDFLTGPSALTPPPLRGERGLGCALSASRTRQPGLRLN